MAKDLKFVRWNEKVKRLSTVIGNGGLALMAAGSARGWAENVNITPAPIFWFLLGSGAIWVSWRVNDMIESEEQ